MFRDYKDRVSGVAGSKRIRPHAIKRCVICNSVNSYETAEGDGDIYMHAYHEVEYGKSGVPAFLCHECFTESRDYITMFDDLVEREDGR